MVSWKPSLSFSQIFHQPRLAFIWVQLRYLGGTKKFSPLWKVVSVGTKKCVPWAGQVVFNVSLETFLSHVKGIEHIKGRTPIYYITAWAVSLDTGNKFFANNKPFLHTVVVRQHAAGPAGGNGCVNNILCLYLVITLVFPSPWASIKVVQLLPGVSAWSREIGCS